MHLVSRIKEPKLSPKCFGNLARIRCDLRSLWRHGDKYLHQEVARWYVGGIKRADKSNIVLWVGGMKAELFMKLADRRLLRRFVPLEFTARKSDLSAVATALCPSNE